VNRITAAIALAAALGALAPAASAGRGPTFEGSCELSGTLKQSPAVTNVPQEGEATAIARGACDGIPARYFARARGSMSCGGGTAEGAGVLMVGRKRIEFTFSEVRGPGAAAVRLEGRHGGSATGAATVSQDEDPVAIAQRCAGPGLDRVDIDIRLIGSLDS
jgi:hypothetical protein